MNKKTIILAGCGGGCDVLLSGSETELATPVEDMMHLLAVKELKIPNKYVCAIGMTCDCHYVLKSELLQRLTNLKNLLLESKIWSLEDPAVKIYYDIAKKYPSIVHSLICSALEGHKDYYLPEQLKSRLLRNTVKLDPWMVTFVRYDLIQLSRTILYLNGLKATMNRDNVDDYIMKWHDNFLSKQLNFSIDSK